MQHGEEPPLRASLDSAMARRCRMPGQREDVYHTCPYWPPLECLADGHELRERGGAAVHLLDGFAKLVRVAHSGHARIARVSDRLWSLAELVYL